MACEARIWPQAQRFTEAFQSCNPLKLYISQSSRREGLKSLYKTNYHANSICPDYPATFLMVSRRWWPFFQAILALYVSLLLLSAVVTGLIWDKCSSTWICILLGLHSIRPSIQTVGIIVTASLRYRRGFLSSSSTEFEKVNYSILSQNRTLRLEKTVFHLSLALSNNPARLSLEERFQSSSTPTSLSLDKSNACSKKRSRTSCLSWRAWRPSLFCLRFVSASFKTMFSCPSFWPSMCLDTYDSHRRQ